MGTLLQSGLAAEVAGGSGSVGVSAWQAHEARVVVLDQACGEVAGEVEGHSRRAAGVVGWQQQHEGAAW